MGRVRSYLIAGNWKMHTLRAEAVDLARRVAEHARSVPAVRVMVAPPFPWLLPVAEALAGSPVALGAQDVHWERKGAYTGAVSPEMLKDAGCEYVIVGHSERRQYFGETDETVFRKLQAAISVGLRPVLCVGETLDQRQAGWTLKVIRRQLWGALEGLTPPAAFTIAYEPVWAIGTGVPAHPEQAQEVHAFIRAEVARIWNASVGLHVLYGGSVTPDNVEGFLRAPDVDGALVGGASLKAEAFCTILDIAQNLSAGRSG